MQFKFVPGFSEAVGDALGLSANSPKHLHKIGLIKNLVEDKGTVFVFVCFVCLFVCCCCLFVWLFCFFVVICLFFNSNYITVDTGK